MTVELPTVAAILVNWNGRELLREALKSLEIDGYVGLTTIVVDNGSTDGSIEMIENEFSSVTLIRSKLNLGFAKGNNAGIEVALRAGVKYLFFLNNDATVIKGSISTLIEILESDPTAGASCPFITYAERPELIWFGGARLIIPFGYIGHKNLRKTFAPEKFIAQETGYITGCAMMVRAEILETIGGFDPAYLLYSEDVDLSLRIRRAGWRLLVTPKAEVRHKVSASTGGGLTPLKAYYRARSQITLLKMWSMRYFRGWVVLMGFFWLSAMSLALLFRGQSHSSVAILRGMLDGARNAVIPDSYRLTIV